MHTIRTNTWTSRARRDRRGATALMVGVMAPAIMGMLAVTVDAGLWVIGQTRLQLAADAAALSTSYLLGSSSFRAMNSASQTSTLQSVALFEAQSAANKLAGTLTTPVTVSMTAYTDVTVTLTSQMSSYFLGAFGIEPPTVRASSKMTLQSGASVSSSLCVLALAGGSSTFGIKVDNSGTISAASCPITSDYSGNPSIYLNTGTISASAINAVGPVVKSNSGGNNMTPATANTVTAVADPYASRTAPAAGSCVTHPDYTAYSASTYVANPATWCGDQTIGGNGSSIQFNPGIYIITGNLTFNNATVNSASGVTFIVKGNFNWTNNSNTSTQITAPTTGTTAGIAIWQPCGTSQTTSFQGGSTLLISGSVYAPCSDVDAGNNAQIAAPLNGQFNMIARTIYSHGSASIRAAVGSAGGTSTAVLTQ